MLAQFAAFAGIGAIGTAAHYLVLIALTQGAGVNAVAASVAGSLVGAAINYLLNYHFTFRSNRPHREAAPRFLFVAGAGIALNAIIMFATVQYGGLHYLISQVLATLAVLVFNFVFNRIWTFADQESSPGPSPLP